MGISSTGSEVDPVEVLRSLGYAGVTEPEPVSGGWDTAIWRFGTPEGKQHVLRVYGSRERAAAASRERIALAGAASAGLPVPTVEGWGDWEGRPAVVLGWRPGVTLFQHAAGRPWDIWRLARRFGRMQARIQSVPVPDPLREGAPFYWLLRTGGGAGFDPGYLEAVGLRSDTFVHMDLHPLNLLVDGGDISGVVDWTNSAAGDPRADLAWTITLLRVAPMPPHPLNIVLKFGRLFFYLGWRRGYEEGCGPIPDLSRFLVWAGTLFINEIESRVGDGRVWATARDFEAVRRWVAHWEERAGNPGG